MKSAIEKFKNADLENLKSEDLLIEIINQKTGYRTKFSHKSALGEKVDIQGMIEILEK